MSVDDEVLEQQLLAVFAHYDIPEPHSGERPFKCPVHDDGHASASVNRARGLWNCHGCGAGGSAVSLVQQKEGIDFNAALTMVRQLTGGTAQVHRPQRSKKRNTRWVPPALRNSA